MQAPAARGCGVGARRPRGRRRRKRPKRRAKTAAKAIFAGGIFSNVLTRQPLALRHENLKILRIFPDSFRWLLTQLRYLLLLGCDADNTAIGTKERNDDSISGVVRQVLDTRVRMLAPFAPFISEEMWEALGNDSSVTIASWPRLDENKFDYAADESETLIINLLTDAQNIIKVTKIKPKKIFIYAAAGWKWNVYQKVLSMVVQGRTNFGEIMKTLINDTSTSKVKESPDIVKRMIDDILSDPLDSRQRKVKLTLDEVKVFEDAKSLLRKELDAEVVIYSEDDQSKIDPKNKAKVARPYKPALYIEESDERL